MITQNINLTLLHTVIHISHTTNCDVAGHLTIYKMEDQTRVSLARIFFVCITDLHFLFLSQFYRIFHSFVVFLHFLGQPSLQIPSPLAFLLQCLSVGLTLLFLLQHKVSGHGYLKIFSRISGKMHATKMPYLNILIFII